MKKSLLFLPAVLLALFISGCGDADKELKSKVPESANVLCLIDGNNAIRTKLYNDHKKDILKELKDASLPEDIFQCRVLIFGSTKEAWGGVLIQSREKQVRTVFDRMVSESAKKKDQFKNFKETTVNGKRIATATVEGKKMAAVQYHENLMLIAVEKTDPDFFEAKNPNPLFKDIILKDMIVSSAVKVEIPQQGQGKKSADQVMQMIPALQKLTAISVNIPFSETDPVMDFRMFFKDDKAAGEMLATVNMGLGFAMQAGEEFAEFTQKLKRNTDKNILTISFRLKDAEEFGKKVQEAQKKKAQLREQQAMQKAKAAQKPAPAPAPQVQPVQKPAPAPAVQAQPAQKPAAAPAKAQPQPAQKPAAPAQKAPAPAAK